MKVLINNLKKSVFSTIVALVATSASADLMVGEIAFTAYNVDGDDDFAIVALTDIINETLYFTDNESDGLGGLLDSNEGALRWDTGVAAINAGTVVVFTDVNSAANPLFGSSIGTLTMPDPGFNLSGTTDGLIAFHGVDSLTPGIFLAAIENVTSAIGDLAGTGLTRGTTMLNFSAGASDDGGEYTGPRAGELNYDDYLDLINDPSNWTTEGSDGELILPINTTAFATAVPEPSTFSFLGFGALLIAFFRRRK